MKIGWLCYGFMHNEFIAADGAANIRMPIIDRLEKRNHEILWLGDVRKQEPHLNKKGWWYNNNLVLEFNRAYKKIKTDGGASCKDFLNQFKFEHLPEIDLLIIEINGMGIKPLLQAKIAEHYHKTGCRVILWDLDNLYSIFKLKLKWLNMNIEDFEIITPYSKKRSKNQIIMYYPYNENNQKYICPLLMRQHYGYIGNDYKRRKKLEKYYNNSNAIIYGKYKDELKNLACSYGGKLMPKEVVDKIFSLLFVVQIVKTDYEKLGLMTQRINETLEAGTILLMDDDIQDALKFIDNKFLVNNMPDIDYWIRRIKLMKYEEYEEIVNTQRDFLKSQLIKLKSTYKDYIQLFEGQNNHNITQNTHIEASEKPASDDKILINKNICPSCKSLDTHDYNDCIMCYNCKVRTYNPNYKAPKNSKVYIDVANGFTNKMSGNKGGRKRYFQGV